MSSTALLWLAFGLAGIVIGIKKGINPAAALLAGLMLGPFSLLMVFVTPEGKKCPECAEMVKVDAKICKHCNYYFGGK